MFVCVFVCFFTQVVLARPGDCLDMMLSYQYRDLRYNDRQFILEVPQKTVFILKQRSNIYPKALIYQFMCSHKLLLTHYKS